MQKENDYFDIQADMGITKHMGGRRATEKLVVLAHIKKGDTILEIGCGVGRTACLLAKNYGVHIKSIDINPKMIKRAKERARKEGIEEQVEFILADAQELPFDDNSFDAVIDESVSAFIPDQSKAFTEYYRVLRPKGYLAINEVTWKDKPSEKMQAYVKLVMGGPTFHEVSGWKSLFEGANFQEIEVQTHELKLWEQFIGELQQLEFFEYLKSFGHFIVQMIINPKYWRFTKDVLSSPKYLFGFTGRVKQGFYVGRK